MISLPIRNYGDMGRLFSRYAEAGGNILPLIERVEAGAASNSWIRRQIEGVLKRHPEFATSAYRRYVPLEISQVARMSLVDPSFPNRLEAAFRRKAHVMRPISERVAAPLNLLLIASSSPMEHTHDQN